MYAHDTIIIALGSNSGAEKSIASAKKMLSGMYHGIRFSRQMLTEPIGMESAPFVNCLAMVHEEADTATVEAALKGIEEACGDSRELRAHGKVVLDADLLLCGGTRRHEPDWARPYIITLMKELCPADDGPCFNTQKRDKE